MEATSYLIVGAGVFGASTALHLVRSVHGAKVTLVDRRRPNPGAASSDYNKIIRADYAGILYMKLGLEARDLWRNDPIFKPFYHECGLLLAEDMGMGRDSFNNYQKLGYDASAELLTPAEARARFPTFQDANWRDVQENFYNPQSGWGEADGALQSLIDAAIKEGVIFELATVASLCLDESRECRGIRVLDGNSTRDILADRVVLCAGAYTPKILADTAPEWDDLQVNGRMVAAGAVQCAATYPPEEEEKLSKAPAHLLAMWHTRGLS